MIKILMIVFLGLISVHASNYNIKKIASGFDIIWGFDFIDKDNIILNEKNGSIYNINIKNKKVYKLLELDVHNRSQGGLLDVKVSPNFSEDNTIFFTYVKSINDMGYTTLAKVKYSNNSLKDFEDILVTKSGTSKNYHFGSRITFSEKYIYFTLGDRGVRNSSQDLSNHNGSVMRLNINGTIPLNNPYINDKEVLDEIYSYGHRNAQGIFYDKKTSNLWLVEHGPRGGDEINLIKPKKNYGWPIVSKGKEYYSSSSVGVSSKDGFEDAYKYYIPSIAPSSLVLYRGKNYPKLNGKILVSALKDRHINILTLDDKSNIISESRILENLNKRIRNISISTDNKIYFSTDSGEIYLLESDPVK